MLEGVFFLTVSSLSPSHLICPSNSLEKNDPKAKSPSFHFENEMHQHNDTIVAPPAGASHCLSARESYLLFVNQ